MVATQSTDETTRISRRAERRRRQTGGFDRAVNGAVPVAYYDEVYRRGAGLQWFWHKERFAMVEAQMPADARRILDVGCGPGTFLGQLRRPYDYALGIDIEEDRIEYAQQHYAGPRLEYRVADATTLEVGAGFDVVTSIEVIEHLNPHDAIGFLDGLRRTLRPGGTLVLATPNYRSWWPALEYVISKVGPVDYRAQHLNPYTQQTLHAVAEDAGFVDIRTGGFFFGAPFLAPLSTKLALRAHRWEQRRIRSWGTEMWLAARRPAN